MSFIGKLGYSLTVALTGLFIVFLGLSILIGCIYALGKILRKSGKRKETPAPAAPVVIPEPVAEAAAEETGMEQDELSAVITAAVMAAAAPEKGKKLVVRSVRRASAWAAAGRAEQVNRF